MIKKKICVLGAYSVGKTSLIQRYVRSIFSDKYHTTIGVKIDQKEVRINSQDYRLILWDINGEDEYQHVKKSYLVGASGYFLVVDGTRRETYDVALELKKLVDETIGDKPFVLLVNKSDIMDEWEIDSILLMDMRKRGWEVLFTSAKSGKNVEEAFGSLVAMMIE